MTAEIRRAIESLRNFDYAKLLEEAAAALGNIDLTFGLPDLPEFEGTAHHYTSAEALEGIVESQTLWATEVRRLNDYDEVTGGWRLVSEWLDQQRSDEVVDTIRQYAPESRRTTDNIFVFSATEVADDAHQWRAYGDDACGAAISIDCSAPLLPGAPEPKSTTGLYFDSTTTTGWHPVIYEKGRAWELLDDLLASARDDKAKQLLDWEYDGKPIGRATLGKEVFKRLAEIAHLVKHPGFSSEREVRLVVSSPSSDQTFFQSLSKGLGAYVQVASPEGSPHGNESARPRGTTLPATKSLPITTVTLGPRFSPLGDSLREARAARLRSFLTESLPQVDVGVSDVPLR